MRVAFIAAECEPWAKTGGLGDVVDALARALGELRLADGSTALDDPVDVYLPRYRTVPVPASGTRRSVLRVPDPTADDGWTELAIIDVPADGYRLRLVDHPPAFDRDDFYGGPAGDYPDNAWRFGLLCRAALEAIRAEGRTVDVLGLHDWQAMPAAVLRDLADPAETAIAGIAIVATIHNLAYHGWTARERVGGFLSPDEAARALAPGADGLDLLKAGIERAELVNTVSPGYAAEALTPAFGMGLDDALAARGDRFGGIVNGLDMRLWDPATDPALAARYDAHDPAGKAACRADLLSGLGFDAADDAPVVGMIGRLDPQKGFDLLAGAARSLVADGVRLVVQGSGDARQAEGLRSLAAREPARVALIERFDRAMARRIYAGVDLFLMPSRFEPCGTGQMIALRYGTPAVVRRTGGLANTVVDEDERPGEGTGFVFDEATPEALRTAILRGGRHRAAGGAAWRGIVARGMAVDWSWAAGPAPAYLAMYRRAISLRAQARQAPEAR